MTTGTSPSGTRTPPTARPRPPMPPDRGPSRTFPAPSPVTGRVAPSAAVLARPMLVLLPVLAFLVPALLISFTRTPTYNAEARLLIGGFDVQAQAVPGFVEASRTLAETYSRLVETDAIVEPVAASLGLSAQEVQGHVSASSIPESSIIRVEGHGSSAEEAITFADAAAAALQEYASGGEGGGSEAALDQFEEASLALRGAQAELDRLTAAAGDSPSSSSQQALAEAEAAVERATLQRDAAAQRYSDTASRGGARPQLVAQAVDTGSDRRSTVMLAVAACLGLGLIVGVALATVVVNRQATPAGTTNRS